MTRALFLCCEASGRCWERWLLHRGSPLLAKLLVLPQRAPRISLCEEGVVGAELGTQGTLPGFRWDLHWAFAISKPAPGRWGWHVVVGTGGTERWPQGLTDIRNQPLFLRFRDWRNI